MCLAAIGLACYLSAVEALHGVIPWFPFLSDWKGGSEAEAQNVQ